MPHVFCAYMSILAIYAPQREGYKRVIGNLNADTENIRQTEKND